MQQPWPPSGLGKGVCRCGGCKKGGMVGLACVRHQRRPRALRACPLSRHVGTFHQPPGGAGGKEWTVHAHVFLHWEYYQPGFENMRKPMSPVYWLKLKKGAVVARVRAGW